MCSFRSFRVTAVSPAPGLPNPLLYFASVCEPGSVFSVSFPERRERACRPSLSGRRLHLVAVGHFSHFGVRAPVFRAVRPCASVRDRLTISYCSGFWHTSFFSLMRDTGCWETHFEVERHFRCLTAHFRDPELHGLAPDHSFCIVFCSFLAGTSVLSPGRSLKGGRPVIVAATSYTSSDALRRPFFALPG